jgi:predicted amidohydrolase
MTTASPGGTYAEFPTTLKVAVVQYDPVKDTPDATEENLRRMAVLVEQAHGAGAKLVLFPELGTCGYKIGDQSVEDAIQAASAVTKVCIHEDLRCI